MSAYDVERLIADVEDYVYNQHAPAVQPDTPADNPVSYDAELQAELVEKALPALRGGSTVRVIVGDSPERYNSVLWFALAFGAQLDRRPHEGAVYLMQ